MIREASTIVVQKVETFWAKARVPTRHHQDSIKKLEKLFNTWKNLKKNSKRTTQKQSENESSFKDTLDDLFDIAHGNALNIMTIQEDKDFLIAQREKGRKGSMSSVDTTLQRQEKNIENRRQMRERQRVKSGEQCETNAEKIDLDTSTSSCSNESNDDPSENVQEPPPKKRGRFNIMTPSLTATLDRTMVSDRSAVMIVAETAKSLGHDINELALNRSTMRRERMKLRKEQFQQMFENFDPNSSFLVVHWDGKMMKDIT